MAISTKLLPNSLVNAIKRSPALYSMSRRARFALGSIVGARAVAGVSGPVHFNDFMLDSTRANDVEHYARGARQFVDLLGRSLEEAGRSWNDVEAALEIGCGYGRIVRELHSQHPHVQIHVNDVIEEGARFTANEFGVAKVPLLERAEEPLRDQFDLIYLLSVYTHMPREMVARSIALVSAALRPGGLVVFTTHGQGSAQTAERYNQFWLDKARVLKSLASQGYYYERYPYYKNEYGLTWFLPDTVKELVSSQAPQMQLISHHAMAIDNHQDVYVYQRK